uniref:hypothetical protein n=1 Tax=Facilibium subflavum TaxID=2219058 RepID=UPI001AAD06D6
MEHAKALEQLLLQFFNHTRHTLECLSHIILGLFVVQSVNFAKISKTFATYSKQASVYKRIH